MNYGGSELNGSSIWNVTTGGEDLIVAERTQNASDWIHTRFQPYISFFNLDDCIVHINGGTAYPIPAGVGFEGDKVESFKIDTASVRYCFQLKW